LTQTGIRLGPRVEDVVLEANAFEGIAQEVDDQRER